jgi:hypothetical protein
MKRFCLAFVAFSLLASAAAAQSLADVAKREEERRKAIKTPSRLYTDADLRRLPAPAAPAGVGQPVSPAVPVTGEQPRPGEQQANAEAAPEKPGAEPAAEHDEAYWRGRITEARAKVERSKLLCDAMQTRINVLTADWSARDDPVQRAALYQDRIKALEELKRLQDEIQDQTKAIADIEEEARRAGVPPGWLR